MYKDFIVNSLPNEFIVYRNRPIANTTRGWGVFSRYPTGELYCRVYPEKDIDFVFKIVDIMIALDVWQDKYLNNSKEENYETR